MTINTNDLLNSILDSLSRIDHAKLEALPDINLYMDQVITFMEKELYPTKRHEEDPILTKTMVNNYVKIICSRRRKRKNIPKSIF